MLSNKHTEFNVTEAEKKLHLIEVPLRGHQLVIAQVEGKTEGFTVSLERESGSILVDQMDGATALDLIAVLKHMSSIVVASEETE